jgi:hypothetical protein
MLTIVDLTHECAARGCTRQTPMRLKYCRQCAVVLRRPNVDAMNKRLPGSFENGKRR